MVDILEISCRVFLPAKNNTLVLLILLSDIFLFHLSFLFHCMCKFFSVCLCNLITFSMICTCLVSCILATTPAPVGNPCNPSPCGPNSQCKVVGTQPACSCLPNYVGRAPNCRPECILDAECPSNLACQNERCRDPCPGVCGTLAQCSVVNHHAVCTCPQGYTGNPNLACILAPPPCKNMF